MAEDLSAYLRGESADSGPACFWSYARDDDDRMRGKLGEISRSLADFYQLETGNPLPIIRDVDNIAWGERWEERVSQGLQNVMFLIPAVTPNYLRSEACRAEITRFEAVCRARGVKDLILPIVLTGRHFIKTDSPDEIARLIANTQYIPFDEVWYTEPTGELWMQTVRKMALSIIKIESFAEEQLNRALTLEVIDSPAVIAGGNVVVDEARRRPIDVENLETFEPEDDPQLAELIDELERSLQLLGLQIATAGKSFKEVTEKLEHWGSTEKPQNAKAANQYYFRIARDIDGSAKSFHRESAEAYNTALEVDTAIRRMQQIAGEMTDTAVSDTLYDTLATGFGEQISGVRETVRQIDDLMPQIADAERYSSLMKKSLRPARNGMKIIRDVANMMIEWSEMGDRNGGSEEDEPRR